ncbi:hypothetical protein [Algoriphagus boritolerans]|uniref:gliding motility protein GldB-related protein n=1 Tax=Algoriphagus boritolerans TaxID=308111 RepID=UPI000AFE0579
MDKYPDFAELYLQQSLYFSPDSLAANLLEVHQDSALRVLYDSVKVEFADISDLENELETASKPSNIIFLILKRLKFTPLFRGSTRI